jgi:hypothetical protein
MDIELQELYGKLINHAIRLKGDDAWNNIYLNIRFEEFISFRHDGFFRDEKEMILFFERREKLLSFE